SDAGRGTGRAAGGNPAFGGTGSACFRADRQVRTGIPRPVAGPPRKRADLAADSRGYATRGIVGENPGVRRNLAVRVRRIPDASARGWPRPEGGAYPLDVSFQELFSRHPLR